jgi:hypothetical protein
MSVGNTFEMMSCSVMPPERMAAMRSVTGGALSIEGGRDRKGIEPACTAQSSRTRHGTHFCNLCDANSAVLTRPDSCHQLIAIRHFKTKASLLLPLGILRALHQCHHCLFLMSSNDYSAFFGRNDDPSKLRMSHRLGLIQMLVSHGSGFRRSNGHFSPSEACVYGWI